MTFASTPFATGASQRNCCNLQVLGVRGRAFGNAAGLGR